MLLEVFINGRDTGKVAEFVQRKDALLLQPADLEPLGLRDPKPRESSEALIPLTDLPGLQYRMDVVTQSLFITAPTQSLLPALLDSGTPGRTQTPIETGLVPAFHEA
jgi:outer membrane usher protein